MTKLPLYSKEFLNIDTKGGITLSKKELYSHRDSFRDWSVRMPWKAFVDVLTKCYGFDMINKRGSSRVFVREDERFTADEPHGREKFVSKEDRKKAIRALTRLGEFQ